MKKIIKLPNVDKTLKTSLFEALEKRRSIRKWSKEDLSLEHISNLLWCACGITKEASKRSKSKRTIPSASNCQCISLYVSLASGVYEYIEEEHELVEVSKLDIRSLLGTQKIIKEAPFGIIYVSDFSKFKTYLGSNDEKKWFVSGTECGAISQNIYLYCASTNLTSLMIGLVDRDKLENILNLDSHKKIIYTHIIANKNL